MLFRSLVFLQTTPDTIQNGNCLSWSTIIVSPHHRLLAPRHPPYALVHLTYLRSFAFVFANVISLNPKMLGSIHFKLIREANSFNEVRIFVLTIVSANDKSLTAYLYGEFVFLHFFFCAVFKDQYLREIFSQNQTMLRMCSTHAVTSVTHAP